eukprot:scaffold53_cov193-Pinguiococcus_pyrenoidosus.AAC.56
MSNAAGPPAQFGVVVPGRPLITDFSPVDTQKAVALLEGEAASRALADPFRLSSRLLCVTLMPTSNSGWGLTSCFASAFPDPADVEELTFFLLPSSPVPQGHGVVLYYSAPPPFESWEVLGAVFAEKPSGTFRTGAGWKEQLRGQPAVQLGISLETIEFIENLQLGASGRDDRMAYGTAVGRDLYNYLMSFEQPLAPSPPSRPVMQGWAARAHPCAARSDGATTSRRGQLAKEFRAEKSARSQLCFEEQYPMMRRRDAQPSLRGARLAHAES